MPAQRSAARCGLGDGHPGVGEQRVIEPDPGTGVVQRVAPGFPGVGADFGSLWQPDGRQFAPIGRPVG